MLFSRILIFLFSILFLSSCINSGSITSEGSKFFPSQEIKVNSGTLVTLSSGSLTENSEIKAVSPGLIRNITIHEDEKDNCLKKFELLSDKQNCTDNFYMKKAMIEKEIVICDDIKNTILKDTCKDNVVLQDITTKNDRIRCKEIKNPEIAGNCFAIVGRQIQSQDQNTKGKIMDPCVGITDKEIKLACTEGVIFNEAVRLRDPVMCKTLIKEVKQVMCANLIKLSLENNNSLK